MLRQQFQMKKDDTVFESSVEGRKEAINWLHEQYETRRGEWDNGTRTAGCRTAAVIVMK